MIFFPPGFENGDKDTIFRIVSLRVEQHEDLFFSPDHRDKQIFSPRTDKYLRTHMRQSKRIRSTFSSCSKNAA